MIKREDVTASWVVHQLTTAPHPPSLTPLASSAGAGLFETFRVSWPRPRRDRILYVFPYSDPGWEARIREVFDFERRAWVAFWRWTKKLDPGTAQVLPFVPLLDPPEDACTCLTLTLDGKTFPALLRPMIDWPPLDHLPKGVDASRLLESGDGWIGLATLLNAVWKGCDEPPDTIELAPIDTLRAWNLLSDGTHVVPTQFRLFHSSYRKLSHW